MQPLTGAKAFVDLDDTLNTFTGSLGVFYGVSEGHHKLTWFDPRCGYDVEAAIGKARAHNGLPPIPSDEFWKLPSHFYAGVQKSEQCERTLKNVYDQFNPEDVYILTASKPDHRLAGMKMDWICRHLPLALQSRVIVAQEKYLLANRLRLLIDDNLQHCEQWKAGGGIAILIPQPWNWIKPK